MSNLYPSMWGPGFNNNIGQYGDTTGEWTAPVIDELLYSERRFTQKGCTLAPGQGVVRHGSVLYSRTDGLFVKEGEAGAGTVAHGLLRDTVDTGTDANGPRKQGNVVISGIAKNSVVQAAQETDGAGLNARIDPVMDTFTF